MENLQATNFTGVIGEIKLEISKPIYFLTFIML